MHLPRLREIPPLCDEIHQLRKDLGMPRRKWDDGSEMGLECFSRHFR